MSMLNLKALINKLKTAKTEQNLVVLFFCKPFVSHCRFQVPSIPHLVKWAEIQNKICERAA